MKKKLLLGKIVALICCLAVCATFIVPLATSAAEGDTTGPKVTFVVSGFDEGELFTMEYEGVTGNFVKTYDKAGKYDVLYVFSDETPVITATGCTARIDSEGKIFVVVSSTAEATVEIKKPAKQYTVTFPADRTGYTIKYAGENAKYVGASAIYEEGKPIQFTVTAEEGKECDVAVDYQPLIPDNNGVYTISNIDADAVVTVTLKDQMYSVTETLLEDGYSYAPSVTKVAHGGIFDFYVVAKEGNKVTAVTVTVGDKNATVISLGNGLYRVTNVTGDVAVAVEAEQTIYNIACKQPANVSVAIADTAEVGTTVTFQVITAPGFKAPEVKLDGVVLYPNGNQYSFVMPKGNVTIEIAAPAANTLTVNYDSIHAVEAGKFTYANVDEALAAVESDCKVHTFVRWTLDGKAVTADDLKALIVNGDAAITLVAVYETDLSALLTLEHIDRENIVTEDESGKVTVTIQVGANMSVADNCLDLTGVQVTFGTIMSNKKVDLDNATVKAAIANGDTKITLNEGAKVVVYPHNETAPLESGHTIYKNLVASKAVADTIMTVANYATFTIDGTTVVVIG